MPDKQKKSRLDTYVLVAKKYPEMPETLGYEYLVETMLTIGPGLPGAMGMIPLDFKEISAFDKLGMYSISERTAIRDLSRAYVSQANVSSAIDCPAPWVKGVEDIEAHNFSKKMSEISQETKNIKPLSGKKKG
jgi:hypothetical protein